MSILTDLIKIEHKLSHGLILVQVFMMRYLCFLLIAILFASCDSSGEAENRRPVVDIFVLRTAEQLQSPHVVTYRVAE